MSATGIFLVVFAAILTASSNLCITRGVHLAGGFRGVSVESFTRLLSQPLFDIGFLTYGIATVVWFRVVSTEPLSIAYPILVGLTFVMVAAGSALILGEPMSLRKFIGLAVILAGILIAAWE